MKNNIVLAILTIIVIYIVYNLSLFSSFLRPDYKIFIDIIYIIGLLPFLLFFYRNVEQSNFKKLKYCTLIVLFSYIILIVMKLYNLVVNNYILGSNLILNSFNYVTIIVFFYYLLVNKELKLKLQSTSVSEYKYLQFGIIISLIMTIINLISSFLVEHDSVLGIFSPLLTFYNRYISPLSLLPFFISIYKSDRFINFFSKNEVDNPDDSNWINFIFIRLGGLLFIILLSFLIGLLIYDGNELAYIGIGFIVLILISFFVNIIQLLRKKLWKKFYSSLAILVLVIYFILNIPL